MGFGSSSSKQALTTILHRCAFPLAAAFTLEAGAVEHPREPNYANIAAQARAFAAAKLAAEEAEKKKAEEAERKKALGTDAEDDEPGKKREREEDEQGDDEEKHVKVKEQKTDAADDEVKVDEGSESKETSTAAADPNAGAWRVFYDQLGRPYYHNTVTSVTQWTAPTA